MYQSLRLACHSLPVVCHAQPLALLDVPKCKRCGLYEQDFFTEDDTFFK